MENPVKNSLPVKLIFLQLFIISLAFLALYHPFIQTLIHDWKTNEDFSHGYLIPFISGYMIWSLRNDLAEIELKPSNWGLVLIGLGLLQLFVAKVGSEFFLQRTSMIVVLFGLSFFLFGRRFTRAVWLPLAYLILMIPLPAIVWNRIAFPMQLFASEMTEHLVRFIGISILREGNVLYLAQMTLEVVEACSGLRSLVSLLALGIAFAFIVNREAWKRWVLFLAVFPIAIVANIIRLTITALLATRYGSEVADGFLHDFSGMLVFACGIGLLIGTQGLINKFSNSAQNRKTA